MARFNLLALTGLLASFAAVSAQSLCDNPVSVEGSGFESFKLQVSLPDENFADPDPYYLTPGGGISHNTSLSGTYTLNTTSGQLIVNGCPVGGLSSENFTVFSPRSAVPSVYIDKVFYLNEPDPGTKQVQWVNADWQDAIDNQAVFGAGNVGDETLVYAFFNQEFPESYFKAYLLVEPVEN